MKDERDSIVKTRFVEQFFLTKEKIPEIDYSLWHQKIDSTVVKLTKESLAPDLRQKRLFVQNLGMADSDQALQFLGKRSFFRNRNFVTRIMLNVMFLLKYFTSLFRLYFNFKGVMIGEKHKEFGIKRNQKILLFGDIFFDKVQKTFTGESN